MLHGKKMNVAKPHNFKNYAKKFWSLVTKGSPNKCWLWHHNKSSNGYGNFLIYKGGKTKTFSAHRVAYQLTFGPTNLQVLHTCDNKLCVNPNHLFVGTQADNMLDKVQKGRNNTQYVTPQQVHNIRRLAKQGIKHSVLAEKFKVSHSNIQHIVKRRSWSWLNEEDI
jgi:hypothetical protein